MRPRVDDHFFPRVFPNIELDYELEFIFFEHPGFFEAFGSRETVVASRTLMVGE